MSYRMNYIICCLIAKHGISFQKCMPGWTNVPEISKNIFLLYKKRLCIFTSAKDPSVIPLKNIIL